MGKTSIVSTDVYNGIGKVVGKIFSRHSLRSADFEIVNLEFDPKYEGTETDFRGDSRNVLTYAKTVEGFDKDIVSPVVLMTSYSAIPIHVLSAGIISTVTPNDKLRPINEGRCFLSIITAGSKPDLAKEWSISLPANIRLDRKVVFIEKFNIYITAGSVETLKSIRSKELTPEQKTPPGTLIEVSVHANVETVREMFYCFNGIIGTVEVEPSLETTGEVMVKIYTADGPIVLTEKIPNTELLNMDTPIYRLWQDFGGIELLIDYDRERLYRGYEDLQSTKSKIPPDAVGIISELRSKVVDLSDTVRNRDITISELKGKAAAESEKTEQEKLKTEQNRIKVVAASSDASSSIFSDTVKMAGAVIGFGGLLAGAIMKYHGASAVGKLVEWAIPMFGIPSIAEVIGGKSILSCIWSIAGSLITTLSVFTSTLVTSIALSPFFGFVTELVSRVKDFIFGWW